MAGRAYVVHIHHPAPRGGSRDPYYKLSAHYKWALTQVRESTAVLYLSSSSAKTKTIWRSACFVEGLSAGPA